MSSSDESGESPYPVADIEYPGVHDILCGRGGHAISHAGNVSFRILVEKYRDKYVVSSRYEKAQITGDIVRMWRSQTPPGRFLIMTDPSKRDSSRWHDIGDLAANKKVAQSLREKKTRNDNEGGRSDRESDIELPSLPPAASAPTSSVAAMPYATPSNRPEEWKQRKLQQQQRKQAAGDRHHDGKGTVAHQQQHPKHQTQRQLKRQQNAFKKQMQKQVEQAEQEVMLAQQQVNQQAQHLQTALILRAQQEAAAAAAQVQMNQIAIQKAQEEILKGQAQAQAQQQQQNQQQQQLLQQQQWIHQHQLVQQQIQQQQFQEQQNQFQQQQMQQQETQVHQAILEGTSDTSTVDSPIMWGDSQEGTDNPMESRDSMAQAMPSARCLTKNVFDYEPTNGSSDSSTAASVIETSEVSKLLYNQLDSFSDTTSEQSSNEGADSGDCGAISDGCGSVAKSSLYPPD